jgi:hypothetical protein
MELLNAGGIAMLSIGPGLTGNMLGSTAGISAGATVYVIVPAAAYGDDGVLGGLGWPWYIAGAVWYVAVDPGWYGVDPGWNDADPLASTEYVGTS